jgi:hypothetical protein
MEIAVSQAQSVGWALVVGGIVAGLGFGAVWLLCDRLPATNTSTVTRVSVLAAQYSAILFVVAVVVGLILAVS